MDAAFAPALDGEVEVIVPADATSIYIGGDFNTVNGVNRRKVAWTYDRRRCPGRPFNASGVNGLVRDLRLVNGTLYMAGLFTQIGGQSRPFLASLNPSTGALTSKIGLTFAGLHNGGVGKVIKIDATPDGNRLLLEGNFTSVDGQPRDQVALVDISVTPAQLESVADQLLHLDLFVVFRQLPA
ncbi:MAG: hypothetical protein IPJ14_15145 [Kineosporiaceae bacterium]|nr:hypothetical protein [Kineosporiaceae bacterium]